MIEIAVIGLLATGLAFRILRMTTGAEGAKPLDRRKFFLHVGGMVLLLAYCLIAPLVKVWIQDRQKETDRVLLDAAEAERLRQAGDPAAAEALSLKALEAGEQRFVPGDPRMPDLLLLRARCLASLRRFPEAEEFLKRARVLRGRVSGEDGPESALEESELGRLYLEMGRTDEGEACLRRALARTERYTGLVPPSLPGTLRSLADLCERTGRAEEARGYRIRAQALSR